MYLRHATVRKNGKTHTYWRLVRSVRREGKVVQEVVANLGELDAHGCAKARELAARMTGRAPQRELFEEELSQDDRVAVKLSAVRTENARVFGNVWLGWTLWRALKLDELCDRLMPAGREEVPWAVMAACW